MSAEDLRGRTVLHRLPAACLWFMLLAGCGGGGSDDTTSPPAGAGTTPSTQTSTAVAFQGDASHSGVASASTPPFPLSPAWQRTFGSTVSYPLIADGKVFVLTADSFNGPAQLTAIDQVSGLDAWRVTIGTAYTATHAYDGGRVFVSGSDNILRAFDAATGVQAWSTLLLTYGQGGTPVVRDGKVYLSTSTRVYAVDGRSGLILWSTPIASFAAVSLSDSGVLLPSSCDGAAAALQQSTGADIWRVAAGPICNFNPSGAVAHAGGRAYVRDYDYASSRPTLVVRNAATGALIGTANVLGTSTLPIPVASSDATFVLNAGTLQRFDPSLQTVAWSFAGDGTLNSAPLLVGGVVMIGGYNGRLFALDAITGTERWSTLVPSGIDAPSEPGYSAVTGMAAANGILVVPNGRNLNTWRLTAP